MKDRQDKGAQPKKRVFRSSDVHKRRVDPRARSKAADKSAKQPANNPETTREDQAAAATQRLEAVASDQAVTQRLDAISSDRAATQRLGAISDDQAVTQRLSTQPTIEGAAAGGEDAARASTAGSESQKGFTAMRGKKGQRPSVRGAAVARPSTTLSDRAAKQNAPETQDVVDGDAEAEPASDGASDAVRNEADTAGASAESSSEGSQSASGRPRPRRRGPVAKARQEKTEGGEGEEGESDKPQGKFPSIAVPKGPNGRTVAIVVAVVVVVLLVLGGVFAFNRWARYDDKADLQGTWYVLNTEVPITIDEEYIHFNDEVSYRYSIDPTEKTMSYTFGPMEGRGRYWFSDDRNHLVITDGDSYTAAGTTVEDLMHAFVDFSVASSGNAVQLPEGEGIIAFSRTPEVGLTSQQVAERAEAEALAARAGNPSPEGLVAKSAACGIAAIQLAWQSAYGYVDPYYGGSYYYYTNDSAYAG